MKNFLKSGLLVAVAVMSLAGSSQAGVLKYSGTTSGATAGYSAYNNIGWSLVMNYAPSVTPIANITSTVLAKTTLTFATATPQVYTFSTVLSSGTIVVDSSADTLTASGMLFTPAFGKLNSFVVTSEFDASASVADDVTLQALGGAIGSTFTGTFEFLDAGASSVLGSVVLSGTVPAPEPGSIAVLCGLGLIVGRRVLKSRSSKKQEVAA
jgi:hypothetical protein